MKELPPLYLITDVARSGRESVLGAIEAAAAAGLRMVQVREKELPDRDLERLIGEVRARAPGETIIIVNRRPALARELGLAGVHLGGEIEQVAAAREQLPVGALIGYSAHAPDEVARALDLGADYASFSPVFAPISKPPVLAPAGIEGLRAACRAAPLPVYALGGITPARVREARRAGAAGVAVIGAILDAPDPAAATREFLQELSKDPGS